MFLFIFFNVVFFVFFGFVFPIAVTIAIAIPVSVTIAIPVSISVSAVRLSVPTVSCATASTCASARRSPDSTGILQYGRR